MRLFDNLPDLVTRKFRKVTSLTHSYKQSQCYDVRLT